MHAASVHPEPGSNSLKKLYIKLYSESAGFRTDYAVLNSLHDLFLLDTVFLELLMFALYFEFTFWFVFQKNCRDFVIIFLSFNFLSFLWKPHCFVLNLSLVVQFSRTISCRSLEFLSCATWILYHILCRLSRGFAKVFLIFSFFLLLSLDATFILYHILSRLSRGFWKVFRSFFSLRAFQCSLAHSFNIISYPSPFVKGFSKKNWKNLKFFSKCPVWLHSFKFYCIDKSPITWYNSNNRAAFGSESGES